MLRAHADGVTVILRGLFALDEVHLGRADEARDKQVARRAIEVERAADLLDMARTQHHDLVGHGHRLDLVVRYINRSDSELLVSCGEFGTHLAAEISIKVTQGFIKQEDRRLSNHRAPNGYPLPLTAAEF